MADDVRVLGFEELVDGCRALFERIEESSVGEFERVAGDVRETGAGRLPRVSGLLASSVVSGRRGATAFVGMGGPDVPYAGWIEFGGEREGGRNSTAERPYYPQGRYLYPVAIEAGPELQRAAGKAAESEIGRFHWQSPT